MEKTMSIDRICRFANQWDEVVKPKIVTPYDHVKEGAKTFEEHVKTHGDKSRFHGWRKKILEATIIVISDLEKGPLSVFGDWVEAMHDLGIGPADARELGLFNAHPDGCDYNQLWHDIAKDSTVHAA
jgi:hypothetical protein